MRLRVIFSMKIETIKFVERFVLGIFPHLLDTSLTFTCQLLVKSVCVSSIKMNFALIYSIDVNDAVNIYFDHSYHAVTRK